ncbi:hypothetical protein AB4Y45_16130 [Paraburkholderia sp. EG287A]|uniref:hypothetical protein n=1 Tax=Paraburkholderia sp. EG285A TaxID=3237009 RepID=UPI0034D222A3
MIESLIEALGLLERFSLPPEKNKAVVPSDCIANNPRDMRPDRPVYLGQGRVSGLDTTCLREATTFST